MTKVDRFSLNLYNKVMIKIIFFDIDGTLVNYGSQCISKPVIESLCKLQEKGIKLFLATGRPNFVIPKFDGIQFDGALAFNGAYCFDQENVLYKNPINKDELKKIQRNAKKINKAIAYATTDEMTCDFYQENLDRYFKMAGQNCPPSKDMKKILEKDIYQMMIATTAKEDEALLEGIQDLKSVRWVDFATDIIPSNGGKEIAIQKILDYYGFKQEETMAFGDGGNDAGMLHYAHIGVAMANGMPEAKDVANYITTDVKEDGIVDALKHFDLL